MNERFFLLPKERQEIIMNAAYRVFAGNKYSKAPMSEIADEGRISKALLFHYFGNKLGLYVYLWDEAMRLTASSIKEFKALEAEDFFDMLQRSMSAKCSIMRKYPYLSQFFLTAYYEDDEKVNEAISDSFENISNESLNMIRSEVDTTGIREGFTLEEIYQDILYASDGFMNQRYRIGMVDADEIEREYGKLVDLWRRAYGK